MFFTANITFTFTWYANGNVFSDGNMTVAYYDNRLNLPTYISLSGNRVIRNTYAADGRKLYTDVRERNVLQDGTRYYNGNLVFDKNKELDYILFDEGRILHENGNFAFEYHLKDHLGSVRVAFVPTVNGKEVVQENAYYPFGATIADLSYAAPLNNNRYGYTNQEQLNDFNLNWYDYIARNYNPLIGRFNSIDPLAEKYYSISPYAYCMNNPVNMIDPDGRNPFALYRVYTAYKTYRAVRAARLASAAVTTTEIVGGVAVTTAAVGYTYNHFVSPGQAKKAQAFFFSGGTNNAVSPEYSHQQKKEKEAKASLNQQQANVQQAMNDHIGEPSPDGTPDPKGRKLGTATKVGLAIGGTSAFVHGSYNLIHSLDGEQSTSQEDNQPIGPEIIKSSEQEPQNIINFFDFLPKPPEPNKEPLVRIPLRPESQ